MSGEDDDKEWKSSHERFVEALARFSALQERITEKQERIANGFYLEVSRAELAAHLIARGLYWTDAEFKLTEQGVVIPPGLQLPDGSPMYGKEQMDILERDHGRAIDAAQSRSKVFTFFAKHLPEGKETFLLDVAMCAMLELVPNV